MALRIWAVVFGIFFIVAGIAGFIPALSPHQLLFGLFMVDPIHNIIHLVSGACAILAAINTRYSQTYFRVFGIIYGLVAILGFISHDLILIHVNLADNYLHAAIAVIALYLGFFFEKLSRLQPEHKEH